MAELTEGAREAIAAHMNDDHADAVTAYVRHFAGRADVDRAAITAIAPDAMTIAATSPSGTATVVIPFDHVLADTDDARDTLIAMARAAAGPVAGH